MSMVAGLAYHMPCGLAEKARAGAHDTWLTCEGISKYGLIPILVYLLGTWPLCTQEAV